RLQLIEWDGDGPVFFDVGPFQDVADQVAGRFDLLPLFGVVHVGVHRHGDLAQLDLLGRPRAGGPLRDDVAPAPARRREGNVDIVVEVFGRLAAAGAGSGHALLDDADDQKLVPAQDDRLADRFVEWE